MYVLNKNLCYELVSFTGYEIRSILHTSIPFKQKIGESGPRLAIERYCIGIAILAQYLKLGHTGHLFNSAVPSYHLSFPVDGKGGIRQKINNIREPSLRFTQGLSVRLIPVMSTETPSTAGVDMSEKLNGIMVVWTKCLSP